LCRLQAVGRAYIAIHRFDVMTPSSTALRSHRTSAGDALSRLFACVLIVAVTVACFWIYDRIAHRQAAFGPMSLRAPAVEYRSDRPSTPAALAPDMNSDAVRHANADVPDEFQKPELKPAPQKAKREAAPHRKKQAPVIARRGSEPAMQAYAWGHRINQMSFRSY
jgi:hypothetical protein